MLARTAFFNNPPFQEPENPIMESKQSLEHKSSTDKGDIFHLEHGQIPDDDAIEETECGKKIWFICMTASTGGFLFGK